MSLESQIKSLLGESASEVLSEDDLALLERETIKTKGGTTITDDDQEDSKDDSDEDQEDSKDDSDEDQEDSGDGDDDSDDQGSDEKTDFGKNKAKVIEEWFSAEDEDSLVEAAIRGKALPHTFVVTHGKYDDEVGTYKGHSAALAAAKAHAKANKKDLGQYEIGMISRSPDDTKGALVRRAQKVFSEGSAPGQSLNLSVGGDGETAASKESKLTVGKGRGDKVALNKVTLEPKADPTDDNGDNARLKKNLSQKEADQNGKVSGPSSGSSVNPEQDKAYQYTQKAASYSISEHIDAMFNGEELSEDFRSKATTIFEAAVNDVIASQIGQIEEHYEQKLEEALEEVTGDLVEKIDGFLNYVVEQWVDENQVALESGMKVEIVNDFIDGLKGLFQEHYVDIPEDKLDIIQEQADRIEELQSIAAQMIEESAELQSELVAIKKFAIIESIGDDLTDVEQEKFAALCEGIEFTTEDDYAEKVETIKESYFPVSRATKSAPRLDEDYTSTTEVTPGADMEKYVESLSGPLKFR